MANVFEVKDLRFKYPKASKNVINGISFAVKEGTIFGLLGPSGAGKSTTQRILTKILGNYQGEIKYYGKDLKDYSKAFYEDVGVGFEMPVHFCKLSAQENLDYFASLYKKNSDYNGLMTRLGLYEARRQMVGEFSKGMKVRLNLIRALINDPQVVFLDEPTAGLDPKNAKTIKDIILELKQAGKTIFITTHLMGDVEQLCDTVVFMNRGEITEMNTVRDLKMKYGRKELSVEYYHNSGLEKRVFPLENIGENSEFISLIKEQKIETIHSGETTLEDIFIKVTGESKHE